MTSVASGGTVDRIAARTLFNVLRAGSGTAARYSSTFFGLVLFISDARVPGIADFGRPGAQALADVLQRIDNADAGEILHALIAKLARHAQADRSAVGRGQLLAVHRVGQ